MNPPLIQSHSARVLPLARHRNLCRPSILFGLLSATLGLVAEGPLDSVGEALTFSGFNDVFRGRFSGLLDAEVYTFQQPAPSLLEASGRSLIAPRLSLFLDAQAGSQLYFFGQARVDRGFDPADHAAVARLDEYALRWTPWEDGRLNFQVGKFSTVVGNWVNRHLSWENPFITAPLVYENPTAIYDTEAPATVAEFTEGLLSPKYEYRPVIWGPSYATGASMSGRLGWLEFAAELKNVGLASYPDDWSALAVGFDHPTTSARLGIRPNLLWNLGASISEGPYFRREALPTLPVGDGLGRYHQWVIGQDVGFAWHHLQIWAEVFESRFQVPLVGDADTLAYYIEAKYRFCLEAFAALRWNQQFFSSVPDGGGGRIDWGQEVWRMDAALGYRFTPHTQAKIQYSLQREASAAHEFGHLFAAQFTVRF